MDWRKFTSGLAVLLVAAAIGGIGASLLTSNELFRTNEMATSALASLVLVFVFLAAVATLGRPWDIWDRTPYW